MAPGGRIDAYLDCNSPYSFFALTWLRNHREALAEHGVEIELHPVFLGGLNVGSGNKPPWTLPAKATYGGFDGPRASKYFGVKRFKAPPFFPIMTLLPLRCMLYIKDHFLNDRFEAQFAELWQCYWHEAMDISKPDIMGQCLSRHFNEAEVKSILEGGTSPKYKQMLNDETKGLVEKGAYGAPWYLVRKGGEGGVVEPFFGSDRFAFMLQFLEVPFTDITIQPAAKGAKL